jgi:pyruvate/2-oxoglutarate dehydrogenase complex dihydrolipoamide dehydrogenase (E3) component
MFTHYDVIIIGIGLDGETLTYKLAPSGKNLPLTE